MNATTGYIGATGAPKQRSGYPALGGASKRCMDLGLALAAILALLPVFALLWCMIKATDRGPALYGHWRIGRNKTQFRCLKFRTMVMDSDAALQRYLAENPEARAEWEATRKLKNDPRVTSIGRLLRRTSMDELPQLINILLGEMSFVGPRPVVHDEIVLYGEDAGFYFRARPGLTGPWQIGGRNDVSFGSRVAFDRRYVEEWSLRRDVAIIFATIPAVLTSRGCY